MATPVTPFALCYPAPWRLQDREVVDRDGFHVHGFENDPDEIEFWRGVVEAVNASAVLVTEENCPGHVARVGDATICARCGIDIDELRPDDGDPLNLAGSGPTPIEPREG